MKKQYLSLILIFILTLSACGNGTAKTDNLGEKIVSGYYISTSACIALGLTDRLVGIEARASERPIYTHAAPVLPELPNVGTAKDFNLEACIALEPDLVILPARLSDQAEIMAELGIVTVLVDPENYTKLIEMIKIIGELTGSTERAERLIKYLEARCEELLARTAGLPEKPSVLMCGVGSYLSAASDGMYQQELIALAGGENIEISGDSWAEISYERLLAMNPDIIIIPSEAGYEIADIKNDPQLTALTAVKRNSIYQMPGMYEAWDSPVPSCMLGALWLLHTLHPQVYSLEELHNETEAFYREFYGFEATEALP